jgi:hypothetical protein
MSACLRHSLASLNACYVESGKEINAPLGVWIAGNFLSAAGGNRGFAKIWPNGWAHSAGGSWRRRAAPAG